jgi:hypothetical protein
MLLPTASRTFLPPLGALPAILQKRLTASTRPGNSCSTYLFWVQVFCTACSLTNTDANLSLRILNQHEILTKDDPHGPRELADDSRMP